MKKLNIKKVGLTLSLVSAISVCSVFTALANWRQNETGWWYEEENGSYIKNDWKLINDKWYYFGEDGYLFTNRTTPDGYKVDNNGEITEKLTERKTEQTTETETIVPETTTVVEIPETETTVAETTPEVTEAPTTTVPETTTVVPTEAPTTVPETTPKSTEYVPVGGWSNEKEAIAIGKEIQEANGWDINPIIIYSSNAAGYGKSNDVISLSKTGNGYDLTLKTRIQTNSTSQGLQAICMLTGISGLYDTIYDAYEGSNSNGINYDTPVNIGGHSYIATNNGSNMVFHIQ